MKPNWLDSLVAWVAPERGMRRARARAALEVLDQLGQRRGYEGARITRRTAGWTAASTGPNAEANASIITLRNRSRQLVRDNPYARRAIQALKASSVGTGIMARWPKTRPENLWKEWVREADYFGELDFYGLQALGAQAVFESGEVLVRRIMPASGNWRAAPLKLQMLEADYLDPTKFGPALGGNYLIGGVEIDSTGRRVAYHLYDRHPGESLWFTSLWQSRRVDASEVLHIFEKDRPGQVRGVPRLSSALMKIRDLDDYEDAELMRKKIAACFAAFVHTDDEGRTLSDKVATDTTQTNLPRQETMSPGMIEYLKTGESVSFGQPPSDSGYGDYTGTQLRAIAVGAGITYEQLTGDLSRVNFSSMRAGRQEFVKLIEQFRWITFIPMFCEATARWFLEAAWDAGKLPTQAYTPIWTPPKWDYVNPLDDVRTDKEELAAGLSSLSEKIRARGQDPEQVFQEMAKERARLGELGVTVDYGIKGSGVGDVVGKDAGAAGPGGDATIGAAPGQK